MSQMEISVKRSERLTHRLARPMIMEPTPATHALFDMGKELNALKDRNAILERELAALREKHRCKSAADEQFAMALTKAQTRIETLDHELTEAAKDIATLTKQLAFAKAVLEEVRPLVKGRLLSLDGRDLSVLERIESAIEIK